jgi:hypothetical protein
MESRKRPHSIEGEPAVQKKRILTGVNGNPHVNGVVSGQEEPNDADNLEVGEIRTLEVHICNKCTGFSSFAKRLSFDE